MFYFTLLFKTLPALSRIFCNSFFGGFTLYTRFVAFLFVKKLHKNNSPWHFSLHVKNQTFSIQLFEGSTDIAALKEIFIDGEYDWDEITSPKVIIDFGAHTGNTALYFHLKYPEAMIYAVEASPNTFKKLVENTKHIPAIKPIFGAISDRDEPLTFFESESSLGSSLYDRGEGKGVEVPGFTLSTFFKNHGLENADFIKVDIEGGEERIFRDVLPEHYSTHFIIEVHTDLMESMNDFALTYFKNAVCIKREVSSKRYLLYARYTTA